MRDSELDYDDLDEESAPWCFSARLSLAILAFFGFMSMATQKVCMDAALICMMNHTSVVTTRHGAGNVTNGSVTSVKETQAAALEKKDIPDYCAPPFRLFPANLSLEPDDDGEFTWTSDEREVISGALYWGYLVVQFPSGWLASRFGGRIVLGGFMILASVTTVLIPIASRVHFVLLVIVRFLGGLGMGAVFPTMHAVWANWAPPEERAALVAVSYSGAMLGTVGTYPLAAVLCRYGFDGGWPSIFYILGGCGVFWCIAWLILANDSPLTHPRISDEEKFYLIDSLAGEADLKPRTEFHVPWCSLLTSLPFLALLISGLACHWGYYTFEKLLPAYMEEVLYFVFIQDPIIAALPYIGLWFFIIISGVWSDKLIARGILGTGATRKIMQCLGTLLPAGMIVGISFLNCRDVTAAVTMLVIGNALCGFQYSGNVVNYLDVAPYYAAIMMGITNTIGLIAGAIGPILLNIFIPQGLQEAWQYVFFASAASLGFGTLCFTLFGTGDLQEWAYREGPDWDSESGSYMTGSETDLHSEGTPPVGKRAKPESPRTPRRERHDRHAARNSDGRARKGRHPHDARKFDKAEKEGDRKKIDSNNTNNTSHKETSHITQHRESPSRKRKDSVSSDLHSSLDSPADFYDALEETIV